VIPAAYATAALVASLALVAALRGRRELARWLGADPWPELRFARAALLAACAGAAAWAFALAWSTPPRLSGAGADVVLALDVSRSMDARDAAPSRLRRALRLSRRVVEASDGVRLALVLFAGEAYAALPLTQDQDALLTYLNAIDSDLVSRPGTDLAAALDVAGAAFDPRSGRKRQVLLFSDGEHGGGDLDAALGRLASLGARVVAVGLGGSEPAPVPGPGGDPLLDDAGRPVGSSRADGVLRRVAQATDGSYFRELEDDPAAGRLLPEATALDAESAPEPEPPEARAVDALALAAALCLALELALSFGRRRARAPGRAPRALFAGLAGLTLLGVGPLSWLAEGDALLAQGQPREALSLYRRAERHLGETPQTQIRVGNALYRLGELDDAAAAWLASLRRLEPSDRALRFTAAFNLGTVLLAREQWGEARDAFWSAMLEDPDDLEAKFNYEWALERLEPEPDVPVPPSPDPSDAEEARDASSGEQRMQEPERSERRERNAEPISREEAERWLRGLEERVDQPLRKQMAADAQPGERARGGQSW
jgi:Ca-activated chloride channel family protein